MDLKRGIVVVSFGDRDSIVLPTIDNVRLFSDLPIKLYTDRVRNIKEDRVTQVYIKTEELKWTDNPRWGVRNCNLWSARAALDAFDSCCVLNDDMRIVNRGYVDGFALAERFGVCVPMNPRIYVKYNAMGADASDNDFMCPDDGPEYAPACNVSPMFVCRGHGRAVNLLHAYRAELQTCMRGTLAFWKASWKTGITPVYLPEQWCVCASNARYIRDYEKTLQGKTYNVEPLMLHWGQQGVRDIFKEVL